MRLTRRAAAGIALGWLAVGQVRRRRTDTARRAVADSVRAASVDKALSSERATALSRERPFVALVMAAYEEGGSVGDVVGALPDTLCGIDACAIVIDDGSSDDTAERALAAGPMGLGELRSGERRRFQQLDIRDGRLGE